MSVKMKRSPRKYNVELPGKHNELVTFQACPLFNHGKEEENNHAKIYFMIHYVAI